MPQVTAAQLHKLNRDPIRDPHLVLMEFQEDGYEEIHRAVVNTEDIDWEGNTYIAADISAVFPNSGEGQPRAQLVASNVDRIFGRAIDASKQRINVRMIGIDYSTGAALIDTKNLLVISSASGMIEISANLEPRASLLEPMPPVPTTEAEFPGVWLA